MNSLTDFLWHTTFTLLWCFVFLSVLTYKAGKDKIFLYYAAYNFLLLLYVGSRADYFFSNENISELGWTIKRLFNWHIQVIYHCVHMFFGIAIVGIATKYPKLYFRLKTYVVISVAVGTLIPVLVLFGVLETTDYDNYFACIHIPVFITVAIIILQKAWKEKGVVVLCFFWGTLIYAILAAIALFSTVLIKNNLIPMYVHPMTLFYIGIIIEIIAFAIGLGFRLQNIYKEKLQYQKDLNEAQAKLQNKLEKRIKIQEQEKIELQQMKEKQELETQLAKLQNKVLRSQMNSHFVFNVLNSIKAFIIDNNSKEAINYLGKFSKFIRKILDSNFYEENTLYEEINTLKLYLDIESIRLQKGFSYDIDIDENVDAENIKFPSLLLQPYVENAIWHGLMPYKGEKKLMINIEQKQKNIVIKIDDNGIGYNKSLHKKSGNTTHHKSFGLEIVNERIKEFNSKNSMNISVKITDKQVFEQNGTRVEIFLEL
ncbi:MAG: histidine kinase [Flavobacteriaceae bacterium]